MSLNAQYRQRVTAETRRLNRVRNKNSRIPSFDVIAHYIINTKGFAITSLVAMVVNAIVVGVDAEMYHFAPDRYFTAQLVIDIISLLGLLIMYYIGLH